VPHETSEQSWAPASENIDHFGCHKWYYAIRCLFV